MIFCKLWMFPQTKFSATPTADETIHKLREAIEHRLQQLLPNPQANRLNHAMYTGVLAPGKRTRSMLMMLACRGFGGNAQAVLDLACAVEMVHTASLFMDDMPCMDNAQIRRGLPAAHVRYGQDVAMLAAVALLSEALRLVASVLGLSSSIRSQLVVVLSHAVGPQGLAKGQYADLRNGESMRGELAITQVNEEKTGVLFTAALEMTALACQVGTHRRTALRAAAVDIGQAFQIRDDLEDGLSTSSQPTKDRHKDVGKSTLVHLLGRETVQRRMHKHLVDAVSHLRTAIPQGEDIVEFTLRAFGLQAHEVDLKTSNAISASRRSNTVRHWLTG